MSARDSQGRYACPHVTLPLLFRRVKCLRVSRGNRTRRLNAMRRARILMEKALRS